MTAFITGARAAIDLRVEATTTLTALTTAARAAIDRRVEATTTLTVSITAAEQHQKQLQKETAATEQRL